MSGIEGFFIILGVCVLSEIVIGVVVYFLQWRDWDGQAQDNNRVDDDNHWNSNGVIYFLRMVWIIKANPISFMVDNNLWVLMVMRGFNYMACIL